MLFVKFLHGRWGWQGAYKGEFADDSVSFDFSDANLKFFDKSRRRNGTFFFYHTVYNSEPRYGKKGANDYYTYK